MRLYLSSYKLGDYPQELLRLTGANRRTAVINNAHDGAPDSRKAATDQLQQDLAAIGLQPQEFDLRDYFGRAADLEKDLAPFGLVFVKGGNCFILKRALEQSGFDKIILKRLAEDTIAYGGFSAGICILGPNLRGIELCDFPDVVPAGYKPDVDWAGLNLIPYLIAPHYRSDHHESAMIEDVVAYMQQNALPYRTMQDGDIIVIEGGAEKFLPRRKPPAPAMPKAGAAS